MKHSIELRMAVVAAVLVFAFAMSGLAQEAEPGSPQGCPDRPNQRPCMFHPRRAHYSSLNPAIPQTPPAGHKFAAHTNVRDLRPRRSQALTKRRRSLGTAMRRPLRSLVIMASSQLRRAYHRTAIPTRPRSTPLAAATPSRSSMPMTTRPPRVTWLGSRYSSAFPCQCRSSRWFGPTPRPPPADFYGVPTDYTGGWEVEESLDIEWAHAMAPSANIYLVEACSNYDTDLQQAVLVANNLVQCGQVGNQSLDPRPRRLAPRHRARAKFR